MMNKTDQPLVGTIERIVYFNDKNGYTVARLIPQAGGDPITIVGYLPNLHDGERIRAHATEVDNPKFGRQFKVQQCEIIPPSTEEGIEKYLSSGLISGVGPVMAKRIVVRFGRDTLEILDKKPERLREIPGIGKATLKKIVASWEEHKHLRETMIFLQAQGISPAFATRIIKQYGGATASVVRENPYRLAYDIHGIGFKHADSIAQKIGIPRDSPARAAAAVLHVLTEMAGEGHVYCPKQHVVDRCGEMLDIPRSVIEEGISKLLAEKKAVIETAVAKEPMYLSPLHIAEVGVVRAFREMQGSLKLLPPIKVDQAVEWLKKQHSVALNEDQCMAVRQAIDNKLLIITGGPGTGKTTVIRALVEIFRAKKQRILLAAPTGRAAKRMEEVTRMPAATIHRLLEYSPVSMSFNRNRENLLECDILIIDEASMLDIVLLYHLLNATPAEASIVLVGDADQLPSVGPGNVLKDLVRSGVVEVVRLAEVFRQSEGSLIIGNAHRINRGEDPQVLHGESAEKSDFHFIERETPEDVAATIEMLVSRRIPDAFRMDPFSDIQVLSPMHKGPAGVSELNARLQGLLNPHGPEILHGTRTLRPRDKVMQTKNNYDKEVFNGDLGIISSIDDNEHQLLVNFDGRLVAYEFTELDELELAYAISVHKSQGSEYRAVVAPVVMQHYVLLQRNLIYTAVTRGKELVVLVGSLEALSAAIRNEKVQHRYTRLAELLKA